MRRRTGFFLFILLLAYIASSGHHAARGHSKFPYCKKVSGSQKTFDWDNDGDKFPDKAELISGNDRTSFRRWFTAISESQFYFYHDQWPKIRRDCAGLICFAYKEALKKHDKKWFKGYKYLTNPAIRDVVVFNYPDVPVIGTALFHKGSGEFENIATAKILMQYNCRYIGHTLDDDVEPGDLLFYRYFDREKMLFHAMVLVRKIKNRRTGLWDGTVVYHTGGDASSNGEVKKLSISALDRHPDDIWHVKPGNPNFMGFYRFNILDYNIK